MTFGLHTKKGPIGKDFNPISAKLFLRQGTVEGLLEKMNIEHPPAIALYVDTYNNVILHI